jgi:hypothetical protein
MRVLVCGSRTFNDHIAVEAFLEGVYFQTADHYEGIVPDLKFVVIEGGARGADALARRWAESASHRSVPVILEEYPADWDHDGNRAGYIRNKKMLEEGQPHYVVAFVDKPLPESKGTAMMVDLARRAGVPTWVVGCSS